MACNCTTWFFYEFTFRGYAGVQFKKLKGSSVNNKNSAYRYLVKSTQLKVQPWSPFFFFFSTWSPRSSHFVHLLLCAQACTALPHPAKVMFPCITWHDITITLYYISLYFITLHVLLIWQEREFDLCPAECVHTGVNNKPTGAEYLLTQMAKSGVAHQITIQVALSDISTHRHLILLRWPNVNTNHF